jgi:hypothetical protein
MRDNQELFRTTLAAHSVNPRNKLVLINQLLTSHMFSKIYYNDIKIFSSLLSSIRCLTNEREQFKVAPKGNLNSHKFYLVIFCAV